MTRAQRFRYQMFVRVRDFGAAHTLLFPEQSKIGQAFARVAEEVTAIETHGKDHVVGTAEARRVKAATRAAVFNYMKTLALAARRVTRPDVKENPFRLSRGRNLARELATARAFIEQAHTRQDEFIEFGLPTTFLSDFTALVNNLQQAVDGRLGSRARRSKALAGIRNAIARGTEVIRDLDALLAIALRDDPDTYAAWSAVRRIEGLASSSRTVTNVASTLTALPEVATTAPVVAPAAAVDAEPATAKAAEPALPASSTPVAPADVAPPASSADVAPSAPSDAPAPPESAPATVAPLQQVLGRAS